MGSGEAQGRLWGAAAREWSELNEPFSAPIYDAVFEAIAIDAGTALLDAGCGSGLAMQLAAKRGAVVTGLDASVPLLDIARERVPHADIRLGDLEALPFSDRAFDAITAFNSVQYTADPMATLRELRRVAKAEAPVAIVTWGAPERCETRVILAAIGGLLPPPPPGVEGPFALSSPGRLESLAESVGLTPEQADDVAMSFVFPDLEAAVRAQLTSGPARLAIEHSGLDATRDALAAAFAGSRLPDNTYQQENAFRYLIARA